LFIKLCFPIEKAFVSQGLFRLGGLILTVQICGTSFPMVQNDEEVRKDRLMVCLDVTHWNRM
jgi:hypothetical protein